MYFMKEPYPNLTIFLIDPKTTGIPRTPHMYACTATCSVCIHLHSQILTLSPCSSFDFSRQRVFLMLHSVKKVQCDEVAREKC